MAYPTIFISGSCDITIPKLGNIDLQDWIEHIYYNIDNRVASHPYLKFFLLNLRLHKQALNQGSYVVNQQLNDAHLTIQQLQQNLSNHDDSVPRKIISMSKNFVNTDPYWKARKKELDALTLFHRKEYGDMISYFDTNSCAEFHWSPLHELLIKYHIQISREDEQITRQKFLHDSSFRHRLIMRNNHIVTHYFDARLLNYMSSVGIELFDFYDYWFRYEFAAGRGMIHSHGVIFSLSHSDRIQNALNTFATSSEINAENDDDVALELEKILQSVECNTETFYSPEFVSMHPAGGERIDSNGVEGSTQK